MKKYLINKDVNLALLQVRCTVIGHGMLIPATIVFNRPIRGLLSKINRGPMGCNFDDYHYAALKQR